MTNFLIEKGYKRGGVDKTLFIRHFDTGIIIAQIYVDDIGLGSTSPSHTCHKVNSDDKKLWHERLGHLNFKSSRKLSYTGAVCGLPKLGKQVLDVYGPCQHGKQLKTTHKVIQQTSTSKVLELLHMDLMGPMQVESITSKRYIFVCENDFSIFT